MVDTVTFLFKDLNVVDFTEMYETSGGNELYIERGRMGKGKKYFSICFSKRCVDQISGYQLL